MKVFSIKPWASIPWAYRTGRQKIHYSISLLSGIYLFFYLGIIWLGSHLLPQSRSNTNAMAILIDTSLSMSATDVKPTRYSHALEIASWVINRYDAAYITIPFGGVPIVRTPASSDKQWIIHTLQQYSLWSYHVNSASMGSAPGNAIWLAWWYLRNSSASQKSILLLGDWNTNTGYSIDAFLPYLVQDNIKILICAIWDDNYILGRNHADSDVINTIDVDRITSIIEKSNGKRWTCNDSKQAIDNILQPLQQIQENPKILVWDMIQTIWQNQVARYIALACILYTIVTSLWWYIRYIFYKEQ